MLAPYCIPSDITWTCLVSQPSATTMSAGRYRDTTGYNPRSKIIEGGSWTRVEEVQILLSRVLMLLSGWLLAAALTTTYVNECVLVRSAMD